jgi:hypothetical protein
MCLTAEHPANFGGRVFCLLHHGMHAQMTDLLIQAGWCYMMLQLQAVHQAWGWTGARA